MICTVFYLKFILNYIIYTYSVFGCEYNYNNTKTLAVRVPKELAPLVLMVLKVFKAHQDSSVSKDFKEILEIKVLLVSQAPLGQKGPLETRGLLAHQVKLEIQVNKKK